MGEIETKEINGTKFLLYPTLEHRSDMLEIFKDAQVETETELLDGSKVKQKGNFNIKRLVNVCSDIVYEGCFKHDEKGKRLDIKDDEKDTTYDDIKGVVINSGVFELYLDIASLINILDKDKIKEIKEKTDNPQ